jgi:hypothetical protein
MAKLDAAEDAAVAQLTKKLDADDLAFFLRISNIMTDGVEPIPSIETGKR